MFVLEQIALCLPLRARYLHGHFANPTLLNSRSALKKYILANNKNIAQGPTFDTQFNRAIKAGVEKGEFAQPKGRSPFLSHLAVYEPHVAIFLPSRRPQCLCLLGFVFPPFMLLSLRSWGPNLLSLSRALIAFTDTYSGTSGTVKLAKKDAAAAPAAKKPAAAKVYPRNCSCTVSHANNCHLQKAAATKTKTATKPKTTTKTAAPKKTATTKAKPGPKKATTATKKTAAKPKANTGTKRKAKTPATVRLNLPTSPLKLC